MATGTLMKNIHSHPTLSEMVPPRIGPAIGATVVVIAQMIIATDAFSGGKMRSSSVIESGMIVPPANPSSTRAPISMPSVLDRPHRSERIPNGR